ncbi:MAG: hypothetical protein HWE26_01770 [Alteromonadaceae bacterium]|nr:hypothetical protein [Alteromonadaceae bacterium]
MIFSNEWRLSIRQPIVWLCLLGLPMFAVLLVQGLTGESLLLAKRVTMLNATIIMLALPIVVAALAPPLLLRDRLSGMHELIDVTPATLFNRRFNQFIAYLSLITVICLTGTMLQLLLLSHHPLFTATVATTAALNTVFIVIPACVLFSALALFLAQRVHSALPVYVFFALCWMGYATLGAINGSPILAGSKIISPLLYDTMLFADPMGLTAIFHQFGNGQQHWQPDSTVVINCLIWLAISTLLVKSSLRTSPTVRNSSLWLRLSSTLIHVIRSALNKIIKNNNLTTPHQLGYSPFATLIIASVKTVLYNRIIALMLAIFASIVFTEVISGLDYAEPMAVITPTSIDALNRVVWDILPFTGCVLMALWSWQLGWQNQRNHAAELIAATPAHNIQLIGAQLTALSLVWLILLTTTGVATMMSQVLANSPVQLSTYLFTLVVSGLPILLFGYLCIAIHHLLRSPIKAGSVCLLLLFVKFTPLPALAGVSHPLLDIAGTPLQPADHLIDFGRSMHTFWPYFSLWAVITLSLLIIASLLTHRGTGFTLHHWRQMPLRGWVCLSVAVVALSDFHLALKQEKPYMTPDARQVLRANYEKRYGDWAQRAQPVITHIDATVDFYPGQRYATLAFTLQLTNTSQELITDVLIGSHYQFVPERITLQQAKLVSQDSDLNQQIFALNSPLRPGDSVQLQANIHVNGLNMWLPSTHQILLNEFSYLRGIPLLPNVGFVQQFTLRDETLRTELDLPPLSLPAPTEFATTNPDTDPGSHPITLRSVVSTPIGQQGLTQGQLVRSWQQDNRWYREYVTQHPIRKIPVWLATTAVSSTETLTVAAQSIKLNFINLTAGRTHNTPVGNEEVHTQAVSDTLEWFTQHLTPYPYQQLSVVFTPEFGPGGYALPQVILLSHRLAMRATPSVDAGFDQRYRRMVHETAHQWFGHTIGYGVNADGSFLIESLAKYAELVIIEQRFGKAAMQALVDYERRRYQHYLRGNLTATTAIIDATSSADVYSRATLVFARLRELVGDETILLVLKQLLERNEPGAKSVTSLDFVTQLNASTAPDHHPEIKELLLGRNLTTLLK